MCVVVVVVVVVVVFGFSVRVFFMGSKAQQTVDFQVKRRKKHRKECVLQEGNTCGLKEGISERGVNNWGLRRGCCG